MSRPGLPRPRFFSAVPRPRADAPALPNLACPPSLRPLASAYPGEVDTGSPIRICADECAAVAQLVRAPDCGSGGRWFESTQLYQYLQQLNADCLVTPPRPEGRASTRGG